MSILIPFPALAHNVATFGYGRVALHLRACAWVVVPEDRMEEASVVLLEVFRELTGIDGLVSVDE